MPVFLPSAGAEGLGAILDQGQAVAFADLADRLQVGRLAEEVYRDDRPGAGVMACSISTGSMLKVRESMSTNTGVAPR